MKKYILLYTGLIPALLVLIVTATQGFCEDDISKYLKTRKDDLALAESEKILSVDPDNIFALWVKAEVMRRDYKFAESEDLLNRILSKDPGHSSSLISLSYIRYHNGKFEEALKILQGVLRQPQLERQNEALACMLIGSINAKRASAGGFFCKLAYGTRIRKFFEKAKAIAPDLAEVRLGAGTFYLLAPGIIGGNTDKAIKDLECAVRLAPDFATANARLAQAYKEKGDLKKSDFYLRKAESLDPGNEVLEEMRGH